jgi:hypothetical protein
VGGAITDAAAETLQINTIESAKTIRMLLQQRKRHWLFHHQNQLHSGVFAVIVYTYIEDAIRAQNLQHCS